MFFFELLLIIYNEISIRAGFCQLFDENVYFNRILSNLYVCTTKAAVTAMIG
jgi:hypothetical protein